MNINDVIGYLYDEWGVSDSRVIELIRNTFPWTKLSGPDARDYDHYDKPPAETVNWDKYVGNIENQADKPRCVYQSREVTGRVHTNIKRGVDCYTENSAMKMVDYDSQSLYDTDKTTKGALDGEGTDPRRGMKMLKKYGLMEIRPNPGEIYRPENYWRCKDQKEAKNDLLTVGPVNICVEWYISFFDTGILRKKKIDYFLGYHDIALTRMNADDVAQGVTRGVNSHGIAFGRLNGLNGHFILPDDQWDIVRESWCCK